MAVYIHLDSCPVWGFESETCNANAFCRYIEMKANPDYKHLSLDELKQKARIAYIASNIFKVLGALIPPLGLARIAIALYRNDEQSTKEALRGVVELSILV